MTPEEAPLDLPQRPPDRVTFTEWEPIYGEERTRHVATNVRGFVFRHVEEYTEVKDRPVIGYRRKRVETWHEPARLALVLTSESESELTFDRQPTPPRTIARWEWETRGIHD